MVEILRGAGIFVYPLGLCSLVGLFIVFERLYALRRQAVLPNDLVDAIIQGRPAKGGEDSVLARILAFAEVHLHDEGAVRAFARAAKRPGNARPPIAADPICKNSRLEFRSTTLSIEAFQ